MTVKTTGAEFKRFWFDKEFWPENVYVEDEIITIDGKDQYTFSSFSESIEDTSIVKISGGCICGYPDKEDGHYSLESFFRKWKKDQTKTSFVVECNIDKIERVKQAIKSAGGRPF